MVFKLKSVSGFGTYPDGRMRAGPFSLPARRLKSAMLSHGILPGTMRPCAMISSTPEGIMISVAGPGVMGYFTDGDGLEASRSDLDSLLLMGVMRGAPFRVSGHYCPEPDVMISSEAIAVHDGRYVSWQSLRRVRRSDGSERVISVSRPGLAQILAMAV